VQLILGWCWCTPPPPPPHPVPQEEDFLIEKTLSHLGVKNIITLWGNTQAEFMYYSSE
jgi:hypothetical protein